MQHVPSMTSICKYKIKNEHIKEIIGVKEKPDIIDVLQQKRPQWYGHVKRMPEERIPKLIMDGYHGREGKEDVQEKRGLKEYKQP